MFTKTYSLVRPKDVARAIELAKQAVKIGTNKDYQRYVDRWLEFLELKEFSDYPFLNGIPPLDRTTRLVLLICFMDSENELSHDYNKAMSAVRCSFGDNLQPLDIFDDPTLTAVRKALQPTARIMNMKRASNWISKASSENRNK